VQCLLLNDTILVSPVRSEAVFTCLS